MEWQGRADRAREGEDDGGGTLARLIYAVPDADLYGVHCGTWLGKYESGPLLLQQIAASAVVCRIRAKLGVGPGTTVHSAEQTGVVA